MSNSIFKKLPKNYQKILIQAAAEVSTYNYKNIVSRDEEYRHKLSQDLEVIKTDISSFKNKIDYSKFELLKSREAQTLVKKIEKIH
jgi:TRAP-type C4-dicarboxylate transport system substrate-binding protein